MVAYVQLFHLLLALQGEGRRGGYKSLRQLGSLQGEEMISAVPHARVIPVVVYG